MASAIIFAQSCSSNSVLRFFVCRLPAPYSLLPHFIFLKSIFFFKRSQLQNHKLLGDRWRYTSSFFVFILCHDLSSRMFGCSHQSSIIWPPTTKTNFFGLLYAPVCSSTRLSSRAALRHPRLPFSLLTRCPLLLPFSSAFLLFFQSIDSFGGHHFYPNTFRSFHSSNPSTSAILFLTLIDRFCHLFSVTLFFFAEFQQLSLSLSLSLFLLHCLASLWHLCVCTQCPFHAFTALHGSFFATAFPRWTHSG